jgi:hypothetical protein
MSRTAEIERLRSRMRQHHFVAISGPRNTGKSRVLQNLKESLETEVRNMREVEQRFKAKAGMKWKVAYIRLNREDNPFDLLTKAIAGPSSNILVGTNEKVDPLFESSIKAALVNSDGQGLMKIYRQFLQIRQYNFLVIIDQFENLFFSTVMSQEDKHKFVQLLLNASYDQRQIYVTLAMRPPKADLWKQNFKELNNAIEHCRFRLYNPNQVELEEAIGQTFFQEHDKLAANNAIEDMISLDWLVQQEIYQSVAVKRIKQIAEDLYEILKGKWKKMLKDSSGAPVGNLVPEQNIRTVTKQITGIVDLIWPQLMLQTNLGNSVGSMEREDLVDDLKTQLTDHLTADLLSRLSRLLAEEIYFEREPLTQIEKHVRQLVRDWHAVLDELRKDARRRSREIITVSMQEQKANAVGAADITFKVNRNGPIQERAETAYLALRTALDKRIARKALTILAQNAMVSPDLSISVDGLGHAMGRFNTRLVPVLEVFVVSGVIDAEPVGALTVNTKLFLTESKVVDSWQRMREWMKGPLDFTTDGSAPMEMDVPARMDLIEDFGENPKGSEEHLARIEILYSNLQPSIRKRAARRLFVEMARRDPNNTGTSESQLISNIGRFEEQLREVIEYFIRQGILAPEGGLHFKESSVPKQWERLREWIKSE